MRIVCQPYIHMRYIPVRGQTRYCGLIREVSGAGDKDKQVPDYIEATIFNKEEAVVMVGNFADVKTSEEVNYHNKVNSLFQQPFTAGQDKLRDEVVQALVLQTCGELPEPGGGRGIYPTAGVSPQTRQGELHHSNRPGSQNHFLSPCYGTPVSSSQRELSCKHNKPKCCRRYSGCWSQ